MSLILNYQMYIFLFCCNLYSYQLYLFHVVLSDIYFYYDVGRSR